MAGIFSSFFFFFLLFIKSYIHFNIVTAHFTAVGGPCMGQVISVHHNDKTSHTQKIPREEDFFNHILYILLKYLLIFFFIYPLTRFRIEEVERGAGNIPYTDSIFEYFNVLLIVAN